MSESTVAQHSSRSKRGLYLWRAHGDEIVPLGGGKLLVPGQGQDFYEVNLLEETCNCPDFTNRAKKEEGFYCKHLFAAMLFTIKNPEAVAAADDKANAGADDEKPAREPSRCAGCGIPSGKPSEGGSILSGKGPGQPLYCMDCNPAFMPKEQAKAAVDRMAEKAGVA